MWERWDRDPAAFLIEPWMPGRQGHRALPGKASHSAPVEVSNAWGGGAQDTDGARQHTQQPAHSSKWGSVAGSQVKKAAPQNSRLAVPAPVALPKSSASSEVLDS